MTDWETSDLFGGRFRIRALLGSGATASVYEALDVTGGGLVALKVLHPHLDVTPGFRAAFLREATIAGAVSHPSVTRLLAFGDDDASGQTWTAWAFAPGVTLSELVRTQGPLDPPAAFAVVDGVLAALDAVHAAGFVHRDVSASNVLVQRVGGGEVAMVTLIDFGLADRPGRSALAGDVLLSDAARAVRPDEPSGVVGNPAYASPEQLRGDAIGVAGDLYQAGGVLHFALVGEPPFVRGSVDETVKAHLGALPPTVSVRVHGLGVDLDRVVVRALLKDPQDRFPSAAAMRAALAAAIGAARPPTPASTPVPERAAATRLLSTSIDRSVPVAPEPRRGAAPMIWVLLAGAAVLVGALVFALVPRGGPVEAREPTEAPSVSAPAPAASTPSSAPPEPRPSASATAPIATVPAALGRSEVEARALITAAGFRLAAQTVSSDGVAPAGTVTATTPAAGEVAAVGTAVALTVASGMNAVPEVRGAPAEDAQYTVASAGFAIVVRRVPSNTVAAGTVIDLDPAPSVRLSLGSRVTLVVSTGAAVPSPTPSPTRSGPEATSTPIAEPGR